MGIFDLSPHSGVSGYDPEVRLLGVDAGTRRRGLSSEAAVALASPRFVASCHRIELRRWGPPLTTTRSVRGKDFRL